MNQDNPRIVILHGGVDEGSVITAILKILDFNAQDETKPIWLYINSNGGNITHGLALMDVMNHVKAPVYTVCTGLAASMGSFLLSCGEKGHRYALPHARILIHQPRVDYTKSPFVGHEEELQASAKSLLSTRDKLEKIIADNCGQPVEKVHADSEKDCWMSAKEAMEYGLIDQVLEPVAGE